MTNSRTSAKDKFCLFCSKGYYAKARPKSKSTKNLDFLNNPENCVVHACQEKKMCFRLFDIAK